ncbi:MAG: IS1182 family transposase [Acidobacteriota bacterium]|nr:MAG: IS1182 family transposase [Acidobacteriota bacterium]QQS39945.1 MAG: IS1182 family transposase [Acidobacteriota bacterium]QQS42159.1 MAG: IS1182 family transposase [Acidobacteriota bacterium]QQS42369.1 MAG: IS1182 family transposase [Acidobacteriota bacterium]QQS42401.1 MAG: IS1182 family transposase [Acidobacteriota bacterium]
MKKKGPVFRKYDQNQPMLLPPSYDELIPENHPVRVVNEVIERIDISGIERGYKGGGASSYHPRMLLKVLVYAYLRNIYSSRKMEQALKENIHFMWLSSGAKPDHNTINDFRGKRLSGELEKVFSEVVQLLAGEGVLSLKEAVLDGTKIEANANRYTFVWGKTVKGNRERIKEQLKQLWAYVEKLYEDEEQTPNEPDFEAMDPEAVERAIEEINEALKDKETDPKTRQKLRYAKKNWPKKLAEYEEKEKLLNGRNSYSKTDPDATFMRMKEDHLGNGQLKPAYNVQASTEGHYILNYTLAQTPADTSALKDHIESYLKKYGGAPESLTADAGYGSEENYEYLGERGITGFVKYNWFHKDVTDKKRREDPFLSDNLRYDEETDTLYCPAGKPMDYIGDKERTSAGGYLQRSRLYKAVNCRGCPMRGPCHKAEGDRVVERNFNLIKHRRRARELLESEEGIEKRKKRMTVEAVFGNIKQNKGFRRFNLRGIEKVTTEMGLIAIAHNLQRFSKARFA